MNKDRIIIIRPRMWLGNLVVGLVLFFVSLVWCINNAFDNLNLFSLTYNSLGDVILNLVLFFVIEGIFLFMIFCYSEVLIIKGSILEIRYMYIIKRTLPADRIDYFEIKNQRNRYRIYDEIKFYVNGKKVRIANSPSELWNSYDELIKYAYHNNVSIKRV